MNTMLYCMCNICKNRESEDCGRFPEFVYEDSPYYDEDFATDCNQCDGECPALYCAVFEPLE